MPTVAFGMNARSSGSAPTNAATSARAASTWPSRFASQEVDGFGLETVLPLSLGGEDRSWARPERAVVEEGDGGIEGPGRSGAHQAPVGGVTTAGVRRGRCGPGNISGPAAPVPAATQLPASTA